MKRIFIVIAALLMFSVLSAQEIQRADTPQGEPAVKKVDLEKKMNTRAYRWFSPAYDLLNNFYGSTDMVGTFINPLFPDSTMVYVSSSDNLAHHVFAHSIGMVCDPYGDANSSYYPNPIDPAYGSTLDSISVAGIYNIVDGTVTDTLILEITHNLPTTDPSFNGVYIADPPDTMWFSPPKMMGSTTLMGYEAKLTDPHKTVIKKPLTVADSGNVYHYIDVDPNLTVPAGHIYGISITFKPGYSYNFGDTLYDYTTQTPKSNGFRYYLYQTSDATANPDLFYDPYADLGRYNLSYVIYTNGRYGTYDNSLLNEIMYPLTNTGILIDLKLDAYVSVDEPQAIDMDIYPNPVADQINVSVEDYRNTTLEVYNLLGKVVKTVELNSQNTQVDVSGLSNGTYIVRVMNGNKVSTKKVIVNK